MSAPMVERWPVPPPNGYTAADLDRIPDLPPHTELIDGSLVFASPRKAFHTLALDLLWRVEDGGGGKMVAYVYELDPATRVYALTGIYHEHIKLTVPFELDIDLTEIERL